LPAAAISSTPWVCSLSSARFSVRLLSALPSDMLMMFALIRPQ